MNPNPLIPELEVSDPKAKAVDGPRMIVSSDLANAKVDPWMPTRFRPDKKAIFLQNLVGATIIRIGAGDKSLNLDGGGLIIDYRTETGEESRVVLEFDECGMRVRYPQTDRGGFQRSLS